MTTNQPGDLSNLLSPLLEMLLAFQESRTREQLRDQVSVDPFLGVELQPKSQEFQAPRAPAASYANPDPDWQPPRYAFTQQWRYVTTANLAADAILLASQLPAQIRGVAGVPVSGMIPAAIIAAHLHVPLYEVETQGQQNAPPGGIHARPQVRRMSAGWRGHSRRVDPTWPLVVVDDTVYGGFAMSRIMAGADPSDLLPAAVYVLPGSERFVRFFAQHLPCPHWLEWNWPNAGMLVGDCINPEIRGGVALDFDGVLCDDPPRAFDESNPIDRQRYLEWIADAPPLNLPRHRSVPLIVTNRAAYTEPATIAWLDRYRIKADRIAFWPGEPESRTWADDFIRQHKAAQYAASDCCLFVESDSWQANAIARHTGRRVLDLQAQQIINPAERAAWALNPQKGRE